MTDPPAAGRFYGDLAAWWPLISPPDEYEEEAAFAATLLRSASIPVREVLELGSGGGNNALHLKAEFAMTLVDLSGPMLEVSRALNPECAHVCGDMRTVRLHRSFDAVFVHDAIDYMTTERDLRQALETAFVHCRPGGVAVFVLTTHERRSRRRATTVAAATSGTSNGPGIPTPTTPGSRPSIASCSVRELPRSRSCTRPTGRVSSARVTGSDCWPTRASTPGR